MKTSDLYLNSTAMMQDLRVRGRLTDLIEGASPDQLRSLIFLALQMRWSIDEVERDLGSNAIERLVDHIENADRGELHRIRQALEIQGVTL